MYFLPKGKQWPFNARRGCEEPAGKGTEDGGVVQDTWKAPEAFPALCDIGDTPWSCPARTFLTEPGGKMEGGSAAAIPFWLGLLLTLTSMASAGSPHGPRAPQPPPSAEQHRQLRALQEARGGNQECPARPAWTRSPGERLSWKEGCLWRRAREHFCACSEDVSPPLRTPVPCGSSTVGPLDH